MTDRVPARDTYDAVLDLRGDDNGRGCVAYGLIKATWRIRPGPGKLELTQARPLFNDVRDDSLKPRIPAHSDFWPVKAFSDVAVIGAAHVPNGKTATRMTVSVSIAERRKSLAIFGNRIVEYNHGQRPRISSPQPFQQMPLGIQHAYGGCDFRAPVDPHDQAALDTVAAQADWPGLYPRNPWGTGYLVVSDPVEGLRLPNQEDPDDLLSDSRLIVSNPAQWYRQPVPAYIDWTPVNCFPRNIYLTVDCDPWYPPPDDHRLAEVASGRLPGGYRTALADRSFGTTPDWRFYQEASPGMMFDEELRGAAVRLAGLHPEFDTISFQLPNPPTAVMKIDGKSEQTPVKLASLEIHPDEEYLTLTYVTEMLSPRPFIPGIHKHIPISLSVDGDKPIHFEAPPTVKERLKAAKEAK